MEERDRRKIMDNLGTLCQMTDLNRLLPKLVERRVFTEDMALKYQDEQVPVSQRVRELYMDIQLRGPRAFRKLLLALSESYQIHLALNMEPCFSLERYNLMEMNEEHLEENGHLHTGAHPLYLPEYMTDENINISDRIHEIALINDEFEFDVGTAPLKINVKKAVERRDIPLENGVNVYPVGSNPKGYFLLINNVKFINDVQQERQGAEVDEANVKLLFQQLGYEVIVYRDLNLEQMKKVILEFSQKVEHRLVDSCFVSIMSHGNRGINVEGSCVVSSDNLSLPVEWIIDQFKNQNCPYLQNKPKVFLFQTCRGDEDDYGTKPEVYNRTQTDGERNMKLRSYSDMLIAFATVPGYTSNRDIYKGTWFLQAICKIFMEHAWNTDIEDMLKMVDQKLARYASDNYVMQTSCYENRGFRKFYFNPGLHD